MTYLLPSLLLVLALFAPPAAEASCTGLRTKVCASDAAEEADARLNQSYSAFKAALDANGANLLLGAQRAWLKYRDANCAVAASGADDDDLRQVFTDFCLASMSDARAKELDEQANQKLGH